jgi:hypothetical protein
MPLNRARVEAFSREATCKHAGACLFVPSDDASWIAGQILDVDHGQAFR